MEWVLLALAGLLIAANAVFVAAEFSLVTVDRATVERRAAEGDRRSQSVLQAVRSLSTQLSGAQLGITVTSLVVGFIAEPSLATILRGPLAAVGVPADAVPGVAFTTAFLVATALQMVLGELVPKNWAIAEPLRVGRWVAGAQRAFTTLSRPLLAVLNGSANALLRAVGVEPREELASARSPGELASLALRSAREGTLEGGKAELLYRSIAFGERRAADVMTPRPRVRWIPASASASDGLDLVARTGHARLPVLGEGVDEVLGAVHFKHLLAVPPDERGSRLLRDLVHPLPAVPASMHLDPLLPLLRGSGMQMAVVVDEYGGTDGVVTLEDLVEEVVGEIADEQDEPASVDTRAQELDGGGWEVSGLLRPDEVEELTGLRLPEGEETDTLGGLVTERLDRMPVEGDDLEVGAQAVDELDEDGVPRPAAVRLEVVRVEDNRVRLVRLQRIDAGPAAGASGAAGDDDDPGSTTEEEERRG